MPNSSSSNEKWTHLWKLLRGQGWKWRQPSGLDLSYRYIRPGRSIKGGIEGGDYFVGEKGVRDFIAKKVAPPLPLQTSEDEKIGNCRSNTSATSASTKNDVEMIAAAAKMCTKKVALTMHYKTRNGDKERNSRFDNYAGPAEDDAEMVVAAGMMSVRKVIPPLHTKTPNGEKKRDQWIQYFCCSCSL